MRMGLFLRAYYDKWLMDDRDLDVSHCLGTLFMIVGTFRGAYSNYTSDPAN